MINIFIGLKDQKDFINKYSVNSCGKMGVANS